MYPTRPQFLYHLPVPQAPQKATTEITFNRTFQFADLGGILNWDCANVDLNGSGADTVKELEAEAVGSLGAVYSEMASPKREAK